MGKKTKFYLVAADALPEIFLKVAEAKRMLHAGEVSTAGEAARQVGISRSAFYKYRDSVQPFNDMYPRSGWPPAAACAARRRSNTFSVSASG